MRIWDLPPHQLCRRHLLGEHRELHAVWTILTTNKKGYAKHPETKRWIGRLAALFTRHELLVEEMARRKYRHQSPLDARLATGLPNQTTFINTPEEQITLLAAKGCTCLVAHQ